MFNLNIWCNSASLPDIRLSNLNDIEFDISGLLNAKCDNSIGPPIHNFLLVFNSNKLGFFTKMQSFFYFDFVIFFDLRIYSQYVATIGIVPVSCILVQRNIFISFHGCILSFKHQSNVSLSGNLMPVLRLIGWHCLPSLWLLVRLHCSYHGSGRCMQLFVMLPQTIRGWSIAHVLSIGEAVVHDDAPQHGYSRGIRSALCNLTDT